MSRRQPDTAAESARLDVWLWSVRLFKTRALAQEAIRRGHVQVNGGNAKPSRALRVGDLVWLSRQGVRDEVEVRELLSKRVSAERAAEALRRTEAGEQMQASDLEQRRIERLQNQTVAPPQRPNRQNRRAIRQFKEQG
ncbi:MAG: S4 domain-containing protein [Pseudomonadota bacterium]|nr:S4 domain-containing protein [Pseudomonadota bacterium]